MSRIALAALTLLVATACDHALDPDPMPLTSIAARPTCGVAHEDEPGFVAGALSSCATIGPQAIAVLYVTWDGATGQRASKEDVEAVFFGPAPSLDAYWQDASYGLTSATGAVFGPYTLPRAYTCSGADVAALNAAALAAADADVDFAQYTRVVVVSPQGPDSGCTILGTSQLGCSAKSTPGDGTFTASITNLLSFYLVDGDGDPAAGVPLAAHELGHALGLGHASSLDFDLDAMAPVGRSGFGVVNEYGGVYTAMANSSLHPGHYDAPHKARLGWLGGRVQVVEADGTYTLAPLELGDAGGPQALKIRRQAGVDEWLWLELRQPIGPWDGALDPRAFTGALVRLERSATDTRSYALDLTPATTTFWDGALTPEASPFVDPYSGLTISLGALGPDGVDVTITYGQPTCTITTPGVTVAPTSAATPAGTPVSLAVTVTNNDAATCPPATYQLSAIRPSSWTFGYSPATLQLAPGQSATTTLTLTPHASAAVGSKSTIAARAFRYGWYKDATASVVVCGDGAPATVTMTPASTTVEAGFTKAFSAGVRNNTCAPQTITASATAPAGWGAALVPASLVLAPGATGAFALTATPPPATPAGPYMIVTQASGGSASATVQVAAAQTRVTTTVPGGPFARQVPLTLVSTSTWGGQSVPVGAAVTFFVKRGNATQTLSTTVGAGGVATRSYTPSQSGTYTTWSMVSYPSPYSTASAAVSFTVP